MNKHIVVEENAEKFWNWLHTCGGMAIWKSVNLSNIGMSWTTPVMDSEGKAISKPSWEAENSPSRIITNPEEVVVSTPKEVKRFHIGVRMGSQGLSFKVTDGGTRRIRREVTNATMKYGKPVWYEFDYEFQDAVIMTAGELVPLVNYAKEKGWEVDVSVQS